MEADHARSQPSLSLNLVKETNVLVDACDRTLNAITIGDLIGKHVPQTDLVQRFGQRRQASSDVAGRSMMVNNCRRSTAQRVHSAERCAHPAGILEQGTIQAPPEIMKHVEKAAGYTHSADTPRVHRVQVHMRVE